MISNLIYDCGQHHRSIVNVQTWTLAVTTIFYGKFRKLSEQNLDFKKLHI